MTSATQIIQNTYGGFGEYRFDQWIQAYLDHPEYTFEFYITIVYRQNETAAIGMTKLESNHHIVAEIDTDRLVISFKLTNIAVARGAQGGGIGSQLVQSIEEMIQDNLMTPLQERTGYDYLYNIWGVGGENVIYRNFGSVNQADYLGRLRRFYGGLGYRLEETDDPFLFYKTQLLPEPMDVDVEGDPPGLEAMVGGARNMYMTNKEAYLRIKLN